MIRSDMASIAIKLKRRARSYYRRGAMRYFRSVLAGRVLPNLAARLTLPSPVADVVVRQERQASRKSWFVATPDEGPPRSRFTAAGLAENGIDWRLVAAETAINVGHAAGRTGLKAADIRFDDATRTAAIDASDRPRLGRDTFAFEAARDADRRRLAAELGLDLLHRARIRELIDEARRTTKVWYAPIDFGRGITTGGSWTIDVGSGRWEYLNGALVAPHVRGKRILELGTNNGVGGLMMLKAGATHVSAIEHDQVFAQTARLAQRIQSWADIHNYQLDVKQGDMRAVLTAELPEFDVVTAFCSLYYLSEEEMAAMVQLAARLSDTMIVQSNDKKHNAPQRGGQTSRSKQASTAFTRQLLLDNGFADVKVTQPKGYSRALLIAKR
jgi:hypothetical protein